MSKTNKSEIVKPRFANNGLYPTIKSNKYLLGMNDKNGNYVLPKFVTLSFLEKNVYYKEGTKGVVCNMRCYLKFDVPFYLMNCLFSDTEFEVKGIALCSDEDEFDFGKGKLIAQAKAEKEAYKVAKAMCVVAQEQLANIVQALNYPINSFEEFDKHNDKFIDKVLDGEIVPTH